MRVFIVLVLVLFSFFFGFYSSHSGLLDRAETVVLQDSKEQLTYADGVEFARSRMEQIGCLPSPERSINRIQASVSSIEGETVKVAIDSLLLDPLLDEDLVIKTASIGPKVLFERSDKTPEAYDLELIEHNELVEEHYRELAADPSLTSELPLAPLPHDLKKYPLVDLEIGDKLLITSDDNIAQTDSFSVTEAILLP